MRLVVSSVLQEHLEAAELPDTGVVFDASATVADWAEAKAVLMSAFAASQEAAVAESPIVYIVHGEDLLGRRGAPSAMVATGLLSAARTAAIELSRKGAAANVIAVGTATPPEAVARWVAHLCDPTGPTGEVVRLDAGHLGKALP